MVHVYQWYQRYRYVDQGSGTTPGLAAEAYAAVKVAKYADQDNFIPFILETGRWSRQQSSPGLA